MHADTPANPTPLRHARALALLVAGAGSLLGACSHHSPVHVTGLAGLGATAANWNAVHDALGSPSGSYGPTVDTGAGTKATYTGVTMSGGHVVGWLMAFAAGTRLVTAEHQLVQELPSDTQQTASLLQARQTGAGACEVVTYQSVQLRLAFVGSSVLGDGKFSVSFFEVEPSGSVSTSYARVNRAVVGFPASVPSPNCP